MEDIRESAFEFAIDVQVPPQCVDEGNVYISAVENDVSNPLVWWRLIHFLHDKCKVEYQQLLQVCEQATENINPQLDTPESPFAKILLAQAKYLFSSHKTNESFSIYEKMHNEKIGIHLYYFWTNYAAALNKCNLLPRAVQLLQNALSLDIFAREDRARIEKVLKGYTRESRSSQEAHTPSPSTASSVSSQLLNTPQARSQDGGDQVRMTPNIVRIQSGETPVQSSSTKSSQRRPITRFPTKLAGPSRVKAPSRESTSSSSSSYSSHSSSITKPKQLAPTTQPKRTNSNTPLTSITNRPSQTSTNRASKTTTSTNQSDRPEKSPVTLNRPTATQIPLHPIIVNGKQFYKLSLLGSGGSSKVYRCIGLLGERKKTEIFAVKEVDLTNQDEETCLGFQNEIQLLLSLKEEKHVVHLYDYEINRNNNNLFLVLEVGDVDLRFLLSRLKRDNSPNQINIIRLYWKQMLEAVRVIHTHRIVHGDLKPANFVSFKGILKLIDFGIASAIQSNTTNIKRDSMIGTINYIAPEALNLTPNPTIKMGTASDVWSLGIILYEMIYHTTPFASITNMYQKMQVIINSTEAMTFPELPKPNDSLMEVLSSCLQRNPKDRMTVEELLSHPFLQ